MFIDMTERLYLSDAYLTTFSARIVERRRLPPAARLAVALDRTAFMPAMAGMVSDRGVLNDVQVGEVLEDDKGVLLHVIAQEIWRDEVQGRLDWGHRLNLMQHHTAQHILSEALAQGAGAETVVTGISPQAAWIELNKPLSEADVERAQVWANQLIATGRAVRVATVDPARVGSLPGWAPGQEPAGGQPVRVFHIEGLRLSVCQAVHVSRTTEIGLLHVTRVNRSNDRPRIEFQCGTRVLNDYSRFEQIVTRLTSLLGAPPDGLEQAALDLKLQAGQAVEALTGLWSKTLEYESTILDLTAERVGDVRVVSRVFPDRDVAETKQLVRLLSDKAGLVILVGTAGARAQLFFACSPDVAHDMNVLMKAAAPVINTQGGGQPRWAESMLVRADAARVEAALAKANKLLQARR